MKADDVIAALGALAQGSRLEIFRLLVKRGREGYTPGELAERMGIPAPTLSFHLKELVRARLVGSRREGRFLYYRASFATMQGVIDFLTQKCCSMSDAGCDSYCTPTGAARTRRA